MPSKTHSTWLIQPLVEESEKPERPGSLQSSAIISSEKRDHISPDKDFCALVRSLNAKQCRRFNYVLEWCLDLKRNKQQLRKPAPFHIFLTGGAGTGKLHIIKAVYQMLMKFLPIQGDTPDDTTVLLTAPTGTAPFQTRGCTLHLAFLLPLGQTKAY